jgi:hypothetical protein
VMIQIGRHDVFQSRGWSIRMGSGQRKGTTVRQTFLIKAITIDGAVPTQENAGRGTYHITRKPYMNTKGDPSPTDRAAASGSV